MGSKTQKKSKSDSKLKASGPAPPAEKIDPSLASLFETSLGAVKAPPKAETAAPVEKEESEEAVDADADLSSVDGDLPSDDDEDAASADDSTEDTPKDDKMRARKRKRLAENEGLEADYMNKLADDEPPREKKKKVDGETSADADDSDSDSSDDEEGSSKKEKKDKKKETAEFPIKHESLISPAETELEKSARTVFLGNVPTCVISSKTDYKTFKTFFKSAGKIVSVRFRSIAFSEQIPRKAAFVNFKLHEKAKSVNAYIVYADAAAARAACKLNGEVVLGHHIRVDSVAHPAPHEPKSCVFVGNLDFEANEESLWKHFGTCGKVESVRIVRDPKNNVGKGFGYVQFEDPMSVEQALLLNEKKMEGDRRKLRISRAKAIKRRDQKPRDTMERRAPPKKSGFVPRADPKQQAQLGRANKLLGKAGAAHLKQHVKAFEGMRASETTDSGIKKGGSGKKGGAKRNRTARSTAWRQKSKGDAK